MRELNFNSVQRPTLMLTMKDEAQTKIPVSMPTEQLIEQLQAVGPDLTAAVQNNDEALLLQIYDLAAKLISCNRVMVKVTSDELRFKYHLNLEDLVLFFGAYVDFIDEIQNAKN